VRYGETDGVRTIAKTYVLGDGQDPAGIPRDGFERDGLLYTLTDITENRTSATDAREHAEVVEISTAGNDLNEIIKLLPPTMGHLTDDGYGGTLALDISSVRCEVGGYRRSSYTVTATREHANLSNTDTSLIPKTVTDNGNELTLAGVSWEAQGHVTVDGEDIPASYRAVARYTGSVPCSVVTGYVTTARYMGTVSRTVPGDTVYTAHFTGEEIAAAPEPEPEPVCELAPAPRLAAAPEAKWEPEHGLAMGQEAGPARKGGGAWTLAALIAGLVALAGVVAAAARHSMRRNVRIYRDNFGTVVADYRIGAKNTVIDLTPLEGDRFGIEIDKAAAKSLSGRNVEVMRHDGVLNHVIAYEGNAYRMDADFTEGTIRAVH